jgi:hypothetical protein
MGAGLSVTGRSNVRPTNIFIIFDIGIIAKPLVLLFIHHFRGSLWNVVLSGYGYYIMITTSDGFE